jgi:hypothetical protein
MVSKMGRNTVTAFELVRCKLTDALDTLEGIANKPYADAREASISAAQRLKEAQEALELADLFLRNEGK